MQPRPQTSSAIPRPLRALNQGSNVGFVAIALALALCSGVGASVVGLSPMPAQAAVLEVPGIAWVDGVSVEAETSVTRMHLVVPDAAAGFLGDDDCVFTHGEPVRLVSEHAGELHAVGARCSGWVSAGWLSGVQRPALGLLK
jgi:hypothetical protein